MSGDLEHLRELIRGAQANLWRWQNSNPYTYHPLNVLGLANKERIELPMIESVLQKNEEQAFHDGDLSSVATNIMPLSQAGDLMREPATRVICELLRVPPVEIPAEEFKTLRALALEAFISDPQIPVPPEIALGETALLELFTQCVPEPKSLALVELTAEQLGDPPDIPRERHIGVQFRPRRSPLLGGVAR